MLFLLCLSLSVKQGEDAGLYLNELESLRAVVRDLRQQVETMLNEIHDQEQIYEPEDNSFGGSHGSMMLWLKRQNEKGDYYPGEENSFAGSAGMGMLSYKGALLQNQMPYDSDPNSYSASQVKQLLNGKQPRPILDSAEDQYDVLY